MAFDSWLSFGTNNESTPTPPGPGTLIADTANTLGHWTADDLNSGKSTVGPIWSILGDIPLNTATGAFPQRDSVGPYLDVTAYYKLTHPSIFNQQTFSAVFVMSCSDLSNTPYFISNGNDLNKGWIAQLDGGSSPTGVQMTVEAGSSANTFTSNKYVQGDVGVLMVGYDAATGTAYAQINNNTLASSAIGANAVLYGTDDTLLGRLSASAGFALNGNIYEVYLSSDVPSHSLFNGFYNQVVANGNSAPLITNSMGVTGHWTASNIASGTSLVGPGWTKVGTVALNDATGSFPKAPSVGPFSDSNYFTLPITNPFNTGAVFSCAVVIDSSDNSNNPEIIGNGDFATNGWVGENLAGDQALAFFAGQQVQFGGAITTSVPYVLFYGWDGDNGYVKYNNGAVATVSVPFNVASTLTTLGNDNALGFPLSSGHIYEVWISTQTPSQVLFDSLYAEILANGS